MAGFRVFLLILLVHLVSRLPLVLILLMLLLLGILFGTRMEMLDDVPDNPDIWTDGSRELIPHLDIEIAGAGAFVHSLAIVFDRNYRGHAQDLDDPHEGSYISSGILGPIQSVQRAEYWGVILALLFWHSCWH